MTPIRHLRYYMVGLLFFASVISYVDRQTLSVNAPYIREDLGLSNTEYGYLVNAFLVAYTIGPIITGRLVDRMGSGLGLSLFIGWWSIAGMMHAATRGLSSLAVFRFLLGLGESGTVPAAMRTISEWFPAQERSFAVGLFAGGTAIGALISPPLVAFLTLSFGWRVCFLVTGALGFLWLIAWRLLYARPEDHPRLGPKEKELIYDGRLETAGEEKTSILDLLRYRKPWGIIVARFTVNPVWWFYLFWLPSYLSDERGFSLKAIGLFAWIPFLAADIGCFLGGWGSSWLLRRTGNLSYSRKIVLFLAAIGMLVGMPAAAVEEVWVCLALISVVTFSYGVWTTTEVTLCADILPSGAVGRMTGLSSTGSALGGILFTMLTGWLVDHFSYSPVFYLAGVIPLLGFALLHTIMGVIEPIKIVKLGDAEPQL